MRSRDQTCLNHDSRKQTDANEGEVDDNVQCARPGGEGKRTIEEPSEGDQNTPREEGRRANHQRAADEQADREVVSHETAEREDQKRK